MSKTSEVLIKMLKENTGCSPLDSGGGSGRHWQRNQSRDFQAEPKVRQSFDAYNGQVSVYAKISTFHWLNAHLEFDPELQAEFDAWLGERDLNPDYNGMLEFAEEMSAMQLDTFNTYNESDYWDLDQVLQVQPFSDDGV